ncbi:hypothetical protein P692DRAFT_20746745 [Suillus brevipes Sb2]|nr:hypothetical protein P692DRAFT_20746745 [Suillus brevipes Sb2]
MPMVTQRDPGSNLRIANAHIIVHQWYDPALQDTIQHCWMTFTPMGANSMSESMPEGRIRKEGLGLSSCAVPLTRVRALNFRRKSGGHPTKLVRL